MSCDKQFCSISLETPSISHELLNEISEIVLRLSMILEQMSRDLDEYIKNELDPFLISELQLTLEVSGVLSEKRKSMFILELESFYFISLLFDKIYHRFSNRKSWLTGIILVDKTLEISDQLKFSRSKRVQLDLLLISYLVHTFI